MFAYEWVSLILTVVSLLIEARMLWLCEQEVKKGKQRREE